MRIRISDDVGAVLTFIVLASMEIGIWYGVCKICGQ
jgi:hypothetical protein